MNAELITEDLEIVSGAIHIALESADDQPIMISVRKRDGRYTCDIAHPVDPEPTV
jgi:hypothetical protein